MCNAYLEIPNMWCVGREQFRNYSLYVGSQKETVSTVHCGKEDHIEMKRYWGGLGGDVMVSEDFRFLGFGFFFNFFFIFHRAAIDLPWPC